MTPDLIVSLPRNVPLPEYRLFQRVRFYQEMDDSTSTGLVVGWQYITAEAIAENSKGGFYPRWLYAVQFDPGYQFGTVGEPELMEGDDILEIVELENGT